MNGRLVNVLLLVVLPSIVPTYGAQDLCDLDLQTLILQLDSEDERNRDKAVDILEPAVGVIEYETWFCGSTKERLDYSCILAPDRHKLDKLVLRHGDERVSQIAISLVQLMGPEGRPALGVLTRTALDCSRSMETRRRAIYAMYFVSGETEAITPLLIPTMEALATVLAGVEPITSREFGGEDVSSASRLAAIDSSATALSHTLFYSGHTVVELPAIMDAVHGTHSVDTQLLLLATLGKLESEAESAVVQLWPMLCDDCDYVRFAAANAILKITRDRAQIPIVAERLQLTDRQRAKFVERAKCEIGEFERQRSQELEAMRDASAEFVPMLTGYVLEGPTPARRAAIRSLGSIGVDAHLAIPVLLDCLDSTRGRTRQLALSALMSIDPSLVLCARSQCMQETSNKCSDSRHRWRFRRCRR